MLDLIDDLGMRMVVPGLLNINETSLIMARTVSKAFGNNYFLIVYAQCLGKLPQL